MSGPRVTLVVPTLEADAALEACLQSLRMQTYPNFDVVVVDNSGQRRSRSLACALGARLVENVRNEGFGAAVNCGWRTSSAPFLGALNDDIVAHPEWLATLVQAMERHPDVGMCAPQILLAGTEVLDSAGMLVAADGSSKQRGHGRPAWEYAREEEVLFPSACAALYRRAMIEQIGGFDEEFFLYCEDVDLGLRARWAGWRCLYVPQAIVEHRYSYTAGRASALKAYYVERNRLFVIAKNFPASSLLRALLAAPARYAWHVAFLLRGRGAAAAFQRQGHPTWRLAWFVARAHAAAAWRLPTLWRQRRAIRRGARIPSEEFRRLLASHAIPLREVAAL
ncbi:MAG: glycosyltransferase family 2 protein [Bryobacterales bacterium]|nr:glycosyltransferase family 2 protein [Bryobacteraceae bacterium]MDW8355415.1 glycosyltransferase family 2 protein [Bryobacterales bacterium]